MGQITIRGIDPEVEQEVRKISKATGKSLNRVIQEIIYQHIGFNQKRKTAPADSLRKLAGGWSEKEAADFLETIKSCEQIDEEMWK
jgi:predicted DNA-binding protein